MRREDLIDLLESLILRPAMYAGTPESAHGMAMALAAMILSLDTGDAMKPTLGKLHTLARSLTAHVPRAVSQAVLLCDEERYPNIRVSFEAFSRHATELLEAIRHR